MRTTPPDSRSRGQEVADRLDQARKQAQRLPRPGTADITLIRGVGPTGIYSLPAPNVLQDVEIALLATDRIYAFGDSLMWDETSDPGNPRLVALVSGYSTASTAKALISRRIMCEAPSQDGTGSIQYPLHASVLNAALVALGSAPGLRHVQVYARRPVYDRDFLLCDNGWHAGSQTLVHASDLEPDIPESVPNPSVRAVERLPPALRRLLGRFCFQSDADVANTLACAITALLVPLFVDVGKPLVIVDGNQAGLGKTLLANVLSVIWDGARARPIAYTPDNEELGKRICAELKSEGTVLVIDNARRGDGKAIESTVLESQCISPVISLRLLGQSNNFTRPNDVLWLMTMNSTRANEDLLSRSIPIRLYWEGAPSERDLTDDPVTYAIEQRYAILAELAGMIERFKERGQTISNRRHRCKEWARIVGGILEANGFPEFLANLADANSAFSETSDEVSHLAEYVLMSMLPVAGSLCGPPSIETPSMPLRSRPSPAGGWIGLFRQVGVCAERLGPSSSHRSMVTAVGRYLSRQMNRTATAVVNGQTWQAVLKSQSVAGNAREYFFEFTPIVGHDTGSDLDGAQTQ